MTDAERAAARDRLEPFYREVGRVVVGQHRLIDRLLTGLLTGGHVLVEGVPGLAKTLAVRTLAAALRLSFHRIQFTPDLLPADVIGTQIFHPGTGEFRTRRGPVFAHVVLADEVNRAPAKVQSALLEAMQERQVTIGDETHALPRPFLVLATQNPIEQEGTYPLPEAQLDRFMMKVLLDYPDRDEEREVLDLTGRVEPDRVVEPVLGPDDVTVLSAAVDETYAADAVKDYVIDLVRATRPATGAVPDLGVYVRHGAGPRASRALLLAAKAQAFLAGRNFLTPQDVKDTAGDVLRHRLVLSYEAEAEDLTADAVLAKVLAAVPVP
jgi:MoxR-like ATPase